ncbi:MAG: extracellular solute-binding protein [Firmicutes bacterium]|nr:extracellular solute-binding protein [Bacillota bacterium]
MRKLKTVLALLLVAVLCLSLFAACAGSKETTTPSTTTPSTTTPSSNTPAPSSNTPASSEETPPANEPENEEPETYDPEDYVEIVMYYFDLRMVGADFGEHIKTKLNEYLGPKYGIQLDLKWLTVGDWIQKVQLSISGGERIDLMNFAVNCGVQTLYNNHMAMDITDYMESEASEAMQVMKDYLDCFRFDGRLYGLPTYRGLVKNDYIVLRKDILEELGMLELAENMDSLEQYEEIMAAVKDNYTATTGLYALSKEGGKSCMPAGLWDGKKFSDAVLYETIGDGTGMVMVLRNGENKVEWLQDDPRYEQKLQWVKTWRDNGWVYPDSALIDTHGDELMKQGVSFSVFTGSEYGVEAVKSGNCGHPVVCPLYLNAIITTGNVMGWGIGVPVTAEEPEAACRMINALYTDAYVMNLLTRGEEGVDYTVVDGEIVYPEEGHYYEADFLLGNNALLLPLQGQGADYFEQIVRINNEAPISDYLGFVLVTGDLQDYISAFSAITDQYSPDLCTGNYTPEMFEAYKTALENADVHGYLNAVQAQLDAWIAANK